MNFRQWLLRFPTIGCGLLVIFSLGFSPERSFAALSIDAKTKTSPDANTSQPLIAEINDVVKGRVVDLTGNDAVKRQAARDALIIEVNTPGATSAFFDTYSKSLNTNLLPLFDLPDTKIRLNAAIIVARVAEKVDNSYLKPVTEKMLADKSDAVVIWGLKASEFILPPLLQVGIPAQQQSFIAAIKSHAQNPMFISLVDEALSLNYQATHGNVPGWKKMVPVVLPEVISLLKTRVDSFSRAIPPEPAADGPATSFLVAPQVWTAATPAQKIEIIQLLSDLFSFAGHRAAVAGPDQDQFVQAAVQSVRAISAAALIEGNQPLSAELAALSKLDKKSPNLSQSIDSLYPKLKAVPAWSALKPPAMENPGATTTPGATSSPAK